MFDISLLLNSEDYNFFINLNDIGLSRYVTTSPKKKNNVDKAPGSGQHVEPGVGLRLGPLLAQNQTADQTG